MGLEQILSIQSYYVEIWEIRSREVQMAEGWLQKFQKEAKTLLGLFVRYFVLGIFGIWSAEADLLPGT